MRFHQILARAIAGAGCLAASVATAQPASDGRPATQPAAHPDGRHAVHGAAARFGLAGNELGFPPDATPVPGLPGAFAHRDVPEGYVLIEGDIQVREADYRAHLDGADGVFGTVNYWPSTIQFEFAPNVDAFMRGQAIVAMNAIMERVGVTFVLGSTNSDRIRFNASTANNSPVGRQGGVQTINIVSWNSTIVIVHEIYHSLGFWHEQSSPSRDEYVIINRENIQPGFEHNFDIRAGASTYGGYDFDSFMHYGRTAFSVNGLDTITVREPWNAQWQSRIGQRTRFSFFDEITCRGIYRFGFDRWWRPGAGGNGSGNIVNPLSNSTFAGAYNAVPADVVLFIKDNLDYRAVGTYSKPMTIRAPMGATLGD